MIRIISAWGLVPGALQFFHQAVQRLSAPRIEALRRNALLDD
jgi:hypothetical protein